MDLDKWWTGRREVPREYLEAYRQALLRMAVLLNCAHPKSGISPSWLRLSDQALVAKVERTKLHERPLERALVSHMMEARAGDDESREPDFDDAENLFYGDFKFETPRGFGPVTRVVHNSTPSFRSWSYKQLHWPEGDGSASLKPREGESESEFMQAAAANYLLKNFFHNYVHHKVQSITSENYHAFSGDARVESDFAADNLGTILFARAFGHEVLTRGQSSPQRRAAVLDMLARNRCNRIFRERDKYRLTPAAKMKREERWAEAEWLFRRRVANSTGDRLLALGASVVDIAVYLTGSVEWAKGGWFFRRGNVVVQLNGVYIQTPFAPNITDPKKEPTPGARRRPGEIANDAAVKYVRMLQQQPALRESAATSMQGLGARLQLPLPG